MSPELTAVVAFRDMVPGDVAFVMDTWSKCWRMSPWAGTVPNNLIHEVVRDTVAGLMARGAKVEVACGRDTQADKILGYVCHEQLPNASVIHWVYVKDPYRRLGLATELVSRNVPQDRRYYTHRTKDSAYFRGFRHAPEIARRK